MSSYYEKFLATGEVKCIDEEIPFEIPEGWEWCRLGMLFSHCTGKALNGINKKGKPYTYITTSNLYWDRFEMSTLKEMYFTDEELDKCTAIKGDLLVCEGGDIGRCAIWNYDYDIRIQNHIHKLRAYLPLCTRFFYHVMFLYKGIGNIGGKGIGIQGLSSGALHNIILPLPSISEQERITAQIETIMPFATKYEKSQDELNRLNDDIYTRLRKSILQEAIQGKLVPQDPNDEPASVLLERIREEKLRLLKEGKLKKKDITDSVIFKGDDNKYFEKKGKTEKDITEEIPFEIPDSWAWVRLSSISDIIGGYAFQSSSLKEKQGKRVIRISDFSEQGFVNTKIVRYDGTPISDIYKLRRFDILMAMTGGTVGKSLFIRELPETEILLNQRVARIRSLWINVDYLYFVIIAPHVKEFICKQKNSTNDNISMTDISNFIIPLPPIKEQIRIVKKLYNLASIMRG